MIVKNYIEDDSSLNWEIEHLKKDYLLSFNFKDNKYYVNCLKHDCINYDIHFFVDYIENDTIQITKDLYLKMLENYNLLPYKNFYISNGFFHDFIVIDNNDREMISEAFMSITLSLLWLYKGYYTTGHNDLYANEI